MENKPGYSLIKYKPKKAVLLVFVPVVGLDELGEPKQKELQAEMKTTAQKYIETSDLTKVRVLFVPLEENKNKETGLFKFMTLYGSYSLAEKKE